MSKKVKSGTFFHAGIYNGYKCDSSYELAFLIYCLDNNIKISRPNKCFSYLDDKGKTRHYFPDFFLDDSEEWVEIKGYKTKLDELKWEQFTEKLIIIDNSKIDKYL